MLLKNYYTLLDAYRHTYVGGSTAYFSSGYAIPAVKLNNGSEVSVTTSMCGAQVYGDKLRGMFGGNTPSASAIYAYPPTSQSIAGTDTYIAFGSGTTPPTIDDYAVEALISNISATATRVINLENGHRVYITFINNNNTSITINEVVMYGSLNASGFAANPALLREVFETPITVEAGESFIYSWDYVTGE